MPNCSISPRFIISTLGNILRSGLAFITTLIIARDLRPQEYGNYAFLLGSFISVTMLIGPGSSNAFQTFVSQKELGQFSVAEDIVRIGTINIYSPYEDDCASDGKQMVGKYIRPIFKSNCVVVA